MFIDNTICQPDTMPLFVGLSKCDQCFDIGYRINPKGGVEQCPRLQCGEVHRLSSAGEIIDRSIRLQIFRKVHIDQFHFEIARTLAGFTKDVPCSNEQLVRAHFQWVDAEHRKCKNPDEAQRREVSKAIRFLREIWLLPVASNKSRPFGYWICTTEAEFKDYFERATSEPVTTLSTLHRMAAANWPVFAEQIELDFWKDFPAVGGPGLRDHIAKLAAACEFIPEGSEIPYDVGMSGITLSDTPDAGVPSELSR